MGKYADERKGHLKEYAEGKGMPIGGTYNYKGTIVAHDHILKIEDGQTKCEVVKNVLRLEGIDCDLLTTKLHSDAHHLNSSQILCYNFFRPLIDSANGSPKLVEKLKDFEVKIETITRCEFEHKDSKGDGTEFDFYIEGKNSNGAVVKVFIEVKYTESSLRNSDAFSKDKKTTYEKKFEETYKPMFKTQQCLKKIPSYNEFYTYYQCFRNVLRVENENAYSIFLYPLKNEIAKKFCEFKDFLADSEENKLYGSNVLFINWEDIVKEGKLYDKYFK